ncbi:DUF2805 domain-containing protein [Hydrogenophaga sp. PAMC20947]|uniref:DUF2805 domain-containing protein n=1 Tax=Hydrogenophaga sp. PAMC20947 TaxID=2565558 RepID=UPI001FFAF852|nr:DUF2805 domain-containing protein [Hydrogenophaga sp. PAMC20947]
MVLARQELKLRSFKMWRERMAGRTTNHATQRHPATQRRRASHARQARAPEQRGKRSRP